jgi:hypothetical protein
MPKIDAAELSREYCRKLSELPKCKKSSTLTADPYRAIPNTLSALPSREYVRKAMLLPR